MLLDATGQLRKDAAGGVRVELILQVIRGYNRGERFSLAQGCALIGRAEGMSVRLLHESVSRHHARIDVTVNGIQLVDLDSANGCRVNGIPCPRAELSPGDRVGIGELELLLVRASSRLDGAPGTEDSQLPPGGPRGHAAWPPPLQFQLWGESPAMRRLFESLEQAARAARPVLIRGEPGSGKELAASALHALSPRRHAPFQCFRCATLTGPEQDGELCGHEQELRERGGQGPGSARRQGLFECACDGSLFFDEVAALSAPVQAKLLQVLETGALRRLGGTADVPIKARIIAATQNDLEMRARQGSFRADLLYRLSVVELQIPPLRERGSDIGLLAARFFEQFCLQTGRKLQLADDVWPLLRRHSWPGNVRELRNTMERTVMLAAGPEVRARNLRLGRRS